MCIYLCDDAKILHGGMRRVQREIEEEIDIPKEILEEERHILYGKELDSSVIEKYYESQLPSKTYQEQFRLDNTLPYVSTYMSIYVLMHVLLYIYIFLFFIYYKKIFEINYFVYL